MTDLRRQSVQMDREQHKATLTGALPETLTGKVENQKPKVELAKGRGNSFRGLPLRPAFSVCYPVDPKDSSFSNGLAKLEP